MKRLPLFALCLILLNTFAFAEKNPSDYPLRVYLLEHLYGPYSYGFSQTFNGRGNVLDGNTITGFDYKYSCQIRLNKTARNQPYFAKWKKPGARLEILALEIGKDNKYQACEIQTTMARGVYVWMSGGITEMSQEDYKNLRIKTGQDFASTGLNIVEKPQTHPKPAAPRQTDKVTATKVSIHSNPADAEIEVDGEFMGNTPSVFQLEAGQHSIVVRKAGYVSWEKKLKVVPGEITLNAELQQQTSAPGNAAK